MNMFEYNIPGQFKFDLTRYHWPTAASKMGIYIGQTPGDFHSKTMGDAVTRSVLFQVKLITDPYGIYYTLTIMEIHTSTGVVNPKQTRLREEFSTHYRSKFLEEAPKYLEPTE